MTNWQVARNDDFRKLSSRERGWEKTQEKKESYNDNRSFKRRSIEDEKKHRMII